jgi:amidase
MMSGMNRREFVGLTAAGILGALAVPTSAARPSTMQTGRFHEASIAGLRRLMETGEATSLDIVQGYLHNIEIFDGRINSIIEKNPDAEEIADRLDAERKDGKIRGPLHGIPIVLKDNIDTADKMKTTAGSLALVNAPVPARDAFFVERLRAAGAVILAKTNLSEWANFRSSNSISGWSGRGGQTRNPYILDRNPCGSSSGSGAAVSANLAAAAFGTETDGSIVCPASICGIVGLKPTVGLVSRSGIIPIAHSQDTAGPMTRTVADAAILLSALTAADPRDPATSQHREKIRTDYENFLQADGLKGARIGVARNYWGRRDEVDRVMNAALKAIKDAGAELVDVKFDSIGKFGDAEFQILLYEFKTDLEKYLAERGGDHKTLADLIRFNEDNAAREMPYFKQEIFEQAVKKGPLTEPEYLEAVKKARQLTRVDGIDGVMDANKLDAVVAPSNAPTWMIDTINGDCGSGYVSSSSLAAVSGYPNITVPAGFERDLPLGISFFGRAYSESSLIKFAYAFEQATKARRAPAFLDTAK